MRNTICYFFLLIPLFFLILMWSGVVANMSFMPDNFLRDDTFDYSGDGLEPTGLISESLFNLINFIAIIPGFFMGLTYAAYKKLWWWLASYILLATHCG